MFLFNANLRQQGLLTGVRGLPVGWVLAFKARRAPQLPKIIPPACCQQDGWIIGRETTA